MKRFVLLCGLAVVGVTSGSVVAQSMETTANGNEAAIDANLSEQKIQAMNAAFTSALNSLTTAMRTCANSDMIYAPGATGANASGCKSVSVPAGTVAAFNLAACPTGWSAYTAGAGRVVVGVGTLGTDTYTLGGTGGAAMRTLTVAQMPAHTHNYSRARANITDIENDTEIDMVQSITQQTVATSSAGSGQAFDNRQAFVGLRYCQKN